MTEAVYTDDWRIGEKNLLDANQQMLEFKKSEKSAKAAQKLKDQKFVAYRLQNPTVLGALALVAHALSKITPDTIGFETVEGRRLKKRHKWIEAEIKEHDRQLRWQKRQLMRETSIWFAPTRMLEAHRRNEECAQFIAAIDPAFSRRLKLEGQRAIFTSEYGQVLEFLNGSPDDQRKISIQSMNLQNAGVRTQLRRIQEDPSLAAALRTDNPAETLANFSLSVQGKNPMLSKESQFGDKREAKKNLDNGRLAYRPEPKILSGSKRTRRGWGAVEPMHKRYKPTPGYGRNYAPRPY